MRKLFTQHQNSFFIGTKLIKIRNQDELEKFFLLLFITIKCFSILSMLLQVSEKI